MDKEKIVAAEAPPKLVPEEPPGESTDQLPGESLDQLPGESLDQLPGESLNQLPGDSLNQLPGESFDQVLGRSTDELPDYYKNRMNRPGLVRVQNIKRRGAKDKASPEKANAKRMFKLIIFTSCALLVGLILYAALVVSFLFSQYSPSPEQQAMYAADRQVNWSDAKKKMQQIIAKAASEHKTEREQAWLIAHYADALMLHGENKEAIKTDENLQSLAKNDPNWANYAVWQKGTAEHRLAMEDPSFKPDVKEVEEAMHQNEQAKFDAQRGAGFKRVLANLYADLGDQKLSDRYFDEASADYKTLNVKGMGHELISDRWRIVMYSTLNSLNKMTPLKSTKASKVVRASSAQTVNDRALQLLNEKKYSDLEKLLQSAAEHRIQYRSGKEWMTRLYDSLTEVNEDSTPAWIKRLDQLNSWQKARPTSPIPHVVLAGFFNSYAWQARGDGYGDSVKPVAWVKFRDRILEASKHLQMALKLGDPSPEWFGTAQVSILGMSRNIDRPMYDKFTEAGQKRYPDFVPLAINKVYYLQPRWHGTKTEWVDFLNKSADAQPDKNEGDMLYARLVDSVSELFHNMPKQVPEVSQERVDRGHKLLDQIYKQNGSNTGRD